MLENHPRGWVSILLVFGTTGFLTLRSGRNIHSPSISLAEIAMDLFCLSLSFSVKSRVDGFPREKKNPNLGTKTIQPD